MARGPALQRPQPEPEPAPGPPENWRELYRLWVAEARLPGGELYDPDPTAHPL